MKFTINKRAILDVLSRVQGLTGRKSNLAITSNVLIQTTESGLSLIATDLETGYAGIYPANIEAEGTIAIDARKFYEIVKDFPEDDISINEVENRWIEIGNQNVEYHIVGMNPDDFPESPNVEEADLFEIESAAFKEMIDKTVIITPEPKEKRAHINGIYLEKIPGDEGTIVRIVSTDGRRLAKIDYTYGADVELPSIPGALIPKKGLVEVSKFLDTEGTVRIGFLNNQFIVEKYQETFIIRLLEGDFPDYKDLLEKRGDHFIHLDKKLFLMMLRRMSILSSDDYRAVIFNFEDDKLLITTTNPELGQSKEEMAIDFQGDRIEVAFNPRYFIDALNVIEEDGVVLNMLDANNACFVNGQKDKRFLSVIMPMKI